MPNIGSASTIHATISYLCGIPLFEPSFFGAFSKYFDNFLPNITCIDDILEKHKYNQVFFSGADGKFAHFSSFIKHRKITLFDVNHLKKVGYLPQDYHKNWGVEDSKLFAFAKQYLNNYNKASPFALFIATVDTHFPNGYIDENVCKDLIIDDAEMYKNAIRCSDRIISDFVEFVRKSRFGKDTTIVILGDHWNMERDFIPPNTNRYIYNVFINPTFSKNTAKNLIKNRELTHYDFSALILDSIGIKAESFGLGRNPLYEKTLIETYGEINFNELLYTPSRIYDSFWQPKN